MLGSGSFFRFSFQSPKIGIGQWTYALAYKPPGLMRSGALQQLILDFCHGPMIPDAVVLVGLKEDVAGGLLDALRSEAMETARQRIGGRIALLYVAVSLKTGAIDVHVLDAKFRHKRTDFIQALKRDAAAWLKAGMEAAFPQSDVLLSAPPGYAYQKPSGARSTVFLKPDLALKSSASVGFVSLSLFLHLYSGHLERLAQLETIFVDTMAISPVAYGLRDLMTLCEHVRPFVIESFHSYGGFDDVVRPLAGTSLCLISASSSMSMHERWIREKQVQQFEVVTLVTLEPVRQYAGGALLALPAPSAGGDEPNEAQFSIRIKGETFLPEHEAAKKVLLREPAHRCDADTKWFREFAGKGVFDAYRRPMETPSKPRALFVDGGRLLEQSQFSEWLLEHSLRRIKASTRLIIHQDDSASEALANQLKVIAEGPLGLSEVQLVSQSSLGGVKLDADDGVIVCAAVVGKGSLLLEISRALRDKHCGARLFVVGFHVTDTREELGSLKLNLQHDKLVSHDFACFGAAAIGRPIQSSFAEEVKQFQQGGIEASAYPGTLGDRLTLLGGASPIGSLALLPHGASVSEPLRLRDTFAFWKEGYVPGPYHAEVLATMAVILQRAREEKKLAEPDRLSASTYRHVVLHPDNFSRFNDGVVQAALLRCAFPSELDYRGDFAGSDFLKGLLLRALGRAADEAGEGFLEFVWALASKRMQLVDTHLQEVVVASRNAEFLDAKLRQAIACLVESSSAAGMAAAMSPI
jgi:hypothetical protein